MSLHASKTSGQMGGGGVNHCGHHGRRTADGEGGMEGSGIRRTSTKRKNILVRIAKYMRYEDYFVTNILCFCRFRRLCAIRSGHP